MLHLALNGSNINRVPLEHFLGPLFISLEFSNLIVDFPLLFLDRGQLLLVRLLACEDLTIQGLIILDGLGITLVVLVDRLDPFIKPAGSLNFIIIESVAKVEPL